MKLGKGRGPAGCYNVQTAVDSQHTLILANDVPNAPGDRAGLSPMALQATDVLGCTFAAVADMGYYHGEEVQTCLEAGITPYIAWPLTLANPQLGRFSKDACAYARATDTAQWPAGARRTCRWATIERARHIRDDATSACNAWARKQQGTRNKGGRRLTRWVEEPLLAEMAQRVRSRPEVMTQRKQRVEHPFGAMKRWWDQGVFLRRGLEQVRTEFSLTGLASTLRRVWNIVGIVRLMAALGSV